MSVEFDLVGTDLRHYRIVSLLGEGGMGAVYAAHDPNLDRRIALKILPPDLVARSDRLARFIQEAKTASGLNHPNVVTIHEIGREELEISGERHVIHFIAMELIDGKTLRAMIRSGELELKRALKIIADVADGLSSAHQAGIIHRDVKPENVMIGPAGNAKILDFGLAKLRTTGEVASEESDTAVMKTDPGAVLGTVGYMSPEQALGKPVDHRSDVFSLGCMLYEVVTGKRPFAGDSSIDTLHKIIHEKPQHLRELSPEAPLQLQWILRKALAKDPNDRYQTVKDLAIDVRDLIREIDSNPELATLSGSVMLPPRRTTRGVRVALALVTLVAVAAVGAIVWQWRASGSATATPELASALQIRPITSTGKVIIAGISPDGKYVAFVESWQGEQSLWVRQLATGQTLELIPAAPVAYWGLSFTIDGSSIVYGLKRGEVRDSALFRIPLIGGTPQRLVDLIDSQATFSPDGTKMAWLRARFPTTDQSAVMVANADGTEERVLAAQRRPALFSPIFHAAPSWSHDGTSIATALMVREDQPGAKIVVLDAETGDEIATLDHGWAWVAAVGWLPDDDGLLAIASEAPELPTQVWLVPYPNGPTRRVTNDLEDYRIISLTGDGESLVTVASDATCDIFTMTGPGGTPKKVSVSTLDGYYGASFTKEGRITYSGLENGRLDLWLVDADGSNRLQLTNDQADDRYPRPAKDGVVYLSFGASGIELRWVSLRGGPSRQIASTTQLDAPSVTPDGEWVFYSTDTDGEPAVWKVPTVGGAPVQMTQMTSFLPSVSPDGTRVAFYYVDDEMNQFRIGVIPVSGGEMIRSIEAHIPNRASKIVWTPDGSALVLNTAERGRADLWLQPLEGGAPEKLTSFGDLMITDFDYAPDGTTLLITRGRLARDAVLITGFR